MPDPTFDLLEEPWIPCELPSGERVELGIRETLRRAHALTAIHDASPLVVATLHRLLLAILERALAPKTRDDWAGWWRMPELPAERLDAYFRPLGERFDLFHPKTPFLQVADLAVQLGRERPGKENAPIPAWRMVIESSPCGPQVELFERMPEDAFLTPAAAARALVALLAYTPGGRIQNEAESWQGGLLRGGAAVQLAGSTLRETLLLNLLWRSARAPDDLPPWEREPTARRVRSSAGPVERLVWPSRRLVLLPVRVEAGWIVREVLTAAGERLEGDLTDEQFSYVVRDPRKPPYAVRIEADRATWRDAAALFDGKSLTDAVHQRPRAMTQLAELVGNRIVARTARHRLLVLGLATDQANIHLARIESLPVPPRLLDDPDSVGTLRLALEQAEQVAKALAGALRKLCEGTLPAPGGTADRQTVGALMASLRAEPAYWDDLGRAFPSWLVDLGNATEGPEAALPRWTDAVRRACWHAFDDARRRIGTHARQLEAAATAETSLRTSLSRILAPAAPTQPLEASAPGA